MADRYGRSSEKTFRSRNRAIAALVRSSTNVVETDVEGLDSALTTQLIDSAYVLARAGGAGGVDSAATISLIDSDYILNKKFVKGDAERRLDIRGTEPTKQHALGDYWLDRDTEIFYKLVASNTWTSTFPSYTYTGYPNLSTFDFGSHTTTASGTFNISGGPTGTFTATWKTGGTTGNNTGFKATFNNPVIFGYYYIGNSVAGWVHRVDYEDGSYAQANGNANTQATSVTWYEANGVAMSGADAKSFSIGNSGTTTQNWLHPRGEKAVSLVYGRSNYGTRNYDAYLFFSGDNFYTRIGEIYDSGDIKSVIDSSYINARIGAGTVEAIVDSAYIQLRDRFQDSAGIISIVDSAYVQARQSNVGGGGVDSAATISLINSVIDSASRQFTYTYTASAGQTSFSGSDDNGATLAYSTGNILTFLNGILLVDSADYTATTGNSIVLNSAASLNDILNVTKFTSATSGSALSHTQYKYTTNTPATIFTGADDNSNTLSYDAGELQVHLNGILLVDSDDYTASNGTSVVLTQATDSNDVVLISVYTGGAGGGSSSSSGGTDSATVISLSGELKGGMFRVNPQTLSQNVTIDSAENAHCAGPISFDSGVVLTINGNLVIS